jgi:hypothetical protein
VRVPSADELLQDPQLSFADFCTIANAIDAGLTPKQILNQPDLAHLRARLDEDPEPEC